MSKYETTAGIPTKGDTYAKLLHHLRESQDCASMMAHLLGADSKQNQTLVHGWLGVEQLIGRMVKSITELATRGLH